MVSLRGRLLYGAMNLFYDRVFPPGLSVESVRKKLKRTLFEPLPRRIQRESSALNGIPGEWIIPPTATPNQVLLYLHGGGYVIKTPPIHRVLVGRLAEAARVRAFIADYRLAPEHPFPAAVDDATASYRGLITQGFAPSKIVIAGDSAGGGLAAALLLNLRDSGDSLPAAAALISGMLDCTLSETTPADHRKRDPFMRREELEMWARHYYGQHEPHTPLISPVFGDLQGMPPLLIQAARDELLSAASVRYASNAKAARVDVTLKLYEGMIHAFPLFAGFVPEGKTAIAEIGAFFRLHLGNTS